MVSSVSGKLKSVPEPIIFVGLLLDIANPGVPLPSEARRNLLEAAPVVGSELGQVELHLGSK